MTSDKKQGRFCQNMTYALKSGSVAGMVRFKNSAGRCLTRNLLASALAVIAATAFSQNAAQAQAIITVPPSVTAQPASTPEPAGEGKVTTTSTERKGRTASDIFLGVYLSLDKECKIGPAPKLEFPTPAQHGKVFTRNFPINLRDVPGAPRRNCIGTSPSGMAVIYRSAPKFKGEETIVFKLTYPNTDIREVSAKVIVQ